MTTQCLARRWGIHMAVVGGALSLYAAGAPAQPADGVVGKPAPAAQGVNVEPAPPRLPDRLTAAQKLVASLPAPTPPRQRVPPPPDAPKPPPPVGPDAPMPSPDPRDLQGGWIRDKPLGVSLARIQADAYGDPLPYTMTGAKLLQRRVMAMYGGNPFSNASATCRPPGAQWQHDIAMPFRVVQTQNYVEFVFEEYHGRWYIQLSPEIARPAHKQYMGHSVGRWDGDTLVVETNGHRQGHWLDFEGTPISADGKLITRIRKVDSGDRKPFLEMATTIVDPLYFTQPWTVIRKFAWNPLISFKEYNCEEQLGDPSVPSDGLAIEPQD